MSLLIKVLKSGPNRTVRPEKPRIVHFVVLLASRTVLYTKSRDPCEPRSDLTVLRTVIRPLLKVPYFPLNMNFKKKKKKNIIYELTEVDLYYCSFKNAVRRWDLRSHHSFFSLYFFILLSFFLCLSILHFLFSLVISAFLPYLSSSLLLLFLVFAFSFTQLDCQPQAIFLGFDFNLVDKNNVFPSHSSRLLALVYILFLKFHGGNG